MSTSLFTGTKIARIARLQKVTTELTSRGHDAFYEYSGGIGWGVKVETPGGHRVFVYADTGKVIWLMECGCPSHLWGRIPSRSSTSAHEITNRVSKLLELIDSTPVDEDPPENWHIQN